MEQIYIGSLKIHDLTDATLQYFVNTPIKGLEFPALRVNSHNKAGQDGIAIPSIYLGERRIQITGVVHDVGSAANHVTLRQAFLSALAPTRDSNGVLTHKVLRFTALDGNEYRLEVEIVNAVMVYDQVRHSAFAIDLLATRAVIESYTQHSQVINPLTRGGFILPAILPVVFSEGTGGKATLNNAGDATAYPIITLAGPLTNPRITNLTTGEFIALTISLTDGESIEIDMLERTVVQGGVTNQLSTVSNDSSFFGLQPGDNSLQLVTGVSGEAGTATIAWRDAYVGV